MPIPAYKISLSSEKKKSNTATISLIILSIDLWMPPSEASQTKAFSHFFTKEIFNKKLKVWKKCLKILSFHLNWLSYGKKFFILWDYNFYFKDQLSFWDSGPWRKHRPRKHCSRLCTLQKLWDLQITNPPQVTLSVKLMISRI